MSYLLFEKDEEITFVKMRSICSGFLMIVTKNCLLKKGLKKVKIKTCIGNCIPYDLLNFDFALKLSIKKNLTKKNALPRELTVYNQQKRLSFLLISLIRYLFSGFTHTHTHTSNQN